MRSGWQGKSLYEIVIDRLSRLERVLVSYGFPDPIPRIQFHLKILQHLQKFPTRIDTDEILWSLVEATELSDIYCSLPSLPRRIFIQKYQAILNGPQHPQEETTESNLARNTMFELYLAGALSNKGVPTEIRHNPDILCVVADRQIFIQCKRPFFRKNTAKNLKLACKQLGRDLSTCGDPRNRGVVALSLSHALNPGEMCPQVRTEADMHRAITSQIRMLVDRILLPLIRGPRIVGLVCQMTTPTFIQDINEYRMGQVMAMYPSTAASDADRRMLRRVFLR